MVLFLLHLRYLMKHGLCWMMISVHLLILMIIKAAA
jgi:hypothetical protein